MRNLSIALIAIGMLLLSAGAVSQTSDPGVLLRVAVEKEEVDGDLNAAVAQYKQIVQNNGGNRAVAARALLRLGGCYEKLGRAEARNIYLRLLNDYPDQAPEVALARQKLAGLAEASTRQARPVFRRVTIPGKINHGAQLSPDGSRLVFESGGDIWVVKLHGNVGPDIAGEPLRLTQGANASRFGLAWSGDGQRIAFNEDKIPSRNMYVVPASGGALRKLTRVGPIMGSDP